MTSRSAIGTSTFPAGAVLTATVNDLYPSCSTRSWYDGFFVNRQFYAKALTNAVRAAIYDAAIYDKGSPRQLRDAPAG